MYRVKNILHLYENIEEVNVKTHSKPGTGYGLIFSFLSQKIGSIKTDVVYGLPLWIQGYYYLHSLFPADPEVSSCKETANRMPCQMMDPAFLL